MAAYRDEVDEMAKNFLGYDIKHVRQEDNMAANTLSKLGSSRKAVPPNVFLEHLHVPSVKIVDPENPELASSPVMAVFAQQSAMGRALPGISDDKEATQRRSPKETN
jgi:hypothetical protein